MMQQPQEAPERGKTATALPAGSLAEKIQALFSAGAVFTFGQKVPPDLKSKKYEPTQPVLGGEVNVASAHDGGAWIGFTLSSGTRCRTASDKDANKLRELIDDPQVTTQGRLGDIGVHLQPTCALH